jgi:uncharacterized protein with ATP-grasp and redox domains
MKNEKKELLKNFKLIIEDLLDNYESYTENEKEQIKYLFQRVADLNTTMLGKQRSLPTATSRCILLFLIFFTNRP